MLRMKKLPRPSKQLSSGTRIVNWGSVRMLRIDKYSGKEGHAMKGIIRTTTLLVTLALMSGIANAGIIITNREVNPAEKNQQTCSEPAEKVDSGIIITNLVGIIITNLTGIIITNANDGGEVNCGIIITN